MNISRLFSKLVLSKSDILFENIVGQGDIKRLFRMALASGKVVLC